MSRLLLFVVIPFVACGCATTPVSSQTAERVPVERVFDQARTNPSAGTHELIVTRDRGMMGVVCATEVYADGNRIANIRTGERVSIYLAVGEHIVGVKPSGACGGGTAQVEVRITPGKVTKLRVAAGQSGDIKIEHSAF